MKRYFREAALVFAVLNIATFIAMRYIWNGFRQVFGPWQGISVVIGLLLVAALILLTVNCYVKKKTLLITGLVLTTPFALLFVVMLIVTVDYTIFFLRNFSSILLILLFLYALFFFVYTTFKKIKLTKKVLYTHTALLIVTLLVGAVNVFDFSLMRFITKPVVYAVNDEYQIVFETSQKSSGQVKIGPETYYNLDNGTLKTNSKVHKIIVPMVELDTHKSYEVTATAFLYRGPYNAVKGRTISHINAFRPLDASDGITFHVASDFHDKMSSTVKSVTYEKEKLDFVVLAGDISSFLERRANISFINKVAYKITNGEIAVIYNRGNHETKGEYLSELAGAVGTFNNNFYYPVKLGSVFLFVLDFAEDHNDDWWEFYGSAHFSSYRDAQLAWLNEVAADENNQYNLNSYDYRFVISHHPLSAINQYEETLFLEQEKEAFVSVLNSLNIDASFAGHLHELYYLADLPNSPLTVLPDFKAKQLAKGTGALFPEFVTSKHALKQADKNRVLFGPYTSLRVEITTHSKQAYFVNSKHEIVEIKNPFTGATENEIIQF
ncbi:MAG TPA: metallophosphoesterase [Bacilli bacterium]|nr:metallophosphoesterase [Bacilli bacterium]